MEEAAVWCDALPSQGALLAVPPAVCAPQGPCPTRASTVYRLGYKAKQGYVIYRICVRCGGRKHSLPKGATYGKPVHCGINRLRFAWNLQSIAEERAGYHRGAPRSWILTGLGKIPRTDSSRLSSLIHSMSLSGGILTPSGSLKQSTSTGRCNGCHQRATGSTTLLVVLAL